jgi:hypothetical protein
MENPWQKYKFLACLLILPPAMALAQEMPYKVERAPFSSRSYNEFAPVVFDGSIVFRSDKRVTGSRRSADSRGNDAMNIYRVNDLGNGEWSNPVLFDSKFYGIRQHHGPATFNQSGDQIWYTKINEESDEDNAMLGIYTAHWDGEEWTDIEPFEYNDVRDNFMHPFLSTDGKMLFFSSDMSGGEGQFDLYVCRKKGAGWSEPENLGPAVNTNRQEIYPLYYPNGRLYFASRGHDPNLGDFDIYYSVYSEGEWQSPVHLDPPINSKRLDAWFYATDTSFTHGYFHSDRQARRIYNIYEFELDLPEDLYEECKLVEENSYCYTFYEAGAMEIDTTQYRYEWVVEGQKFRQEEVDYCFEGIGNYIIALNVIDLLSGEVLFNEATYNLEIENIEQVYIASPDTVYTNEPVMFRGTETFLKDFTIDRYIWDMGDHSWIADTTIQYHYYRPGTYTVKLGVVDEADEPEQVQKTCGFKRLVVLPGRRGPVTPEQ